MDKMREEFEHWCVLAYLCTYKIDDKYKYMQTELAWRAWKASRAALCVELPRPKECDGAMVLIFDVDEALDEAGISHK